MTVPQVNKDIQRASHSSSAFIQHLLHYPFISDGIDALKTNDYGQNLIKLGDYIYKTFTVFAIPGFSPPYEYVAPYIIKADSFGDKTLNRLDEHFPTVKRPTTELYNNIEDIILLPYHKGLEAKDHILRVYSTEFKKIGQQGLASRGKAAVITVVVVGNETLNWAGSYLAAKMAGGAHADNKVNRWPAYIARQ